MNTSITEEKQGSSKSQETNEIGCTIDVKNEPGLTQSIGRV